MKLYVGNLSFETTENDLQDLFEQHGQVSEVTLMMDRMTGKSRGFAFVTMNDKAQADAAMAALNGKDLNGRALNVNEARPREDRKGGGGGGGGYGGGGKRSFAGGNRREFGLQPALIRLSAGSRQSSWQPKKESRFEEQSHRSSPERWFA